VDAVPAVRELARQLGVDLAQVPGTGPEGRVMRRDVEAFHEQMEKGGPSPAPTPSGAPASPDEPDWTRRPLRGLRRQIAERMVRAKALIPHYTYVEEVDVTRLEAGRRSLAEAPGQEKLSPLAFIASAAVRALSHHPLLNACLDDQAEEVILKGKVHLGIAVATEDGLVVPVIRDAAERTVPELAATIRDLAERARAKQLTPPELRGSTFTITSLGKTGGVMATPIIKYPASAILGVHAIRTLPRYVEGRVEPREILNLSISLDHRIVDGFEGARFIQAVKETLEQADFPEFNHG
jgi:pyruvate dehydrogenase E2 component (dihydrolipoamide acetyltransferase)